MFLGCVAFGAFVVVADDFKVTGFPMLILVAPPMEDLGFVIVDELVDSSAGWTLARFDI